jgi:hypothetical protein
MAHEEPLLAMLVTQTRVAVVVAAVLPQHQIKTRHTQVAQVVQAL